MFSRKFWIFQKLIQEVFRKYITRIISQQYIKIKTITFICNNSLFRELIDWRKGREHVFRDDRLDLLSATLREYAIRLSYLLFFFLPCAALHVYLRNSYAAIEYTQRASLPEVYTYEDCFHISIVLRV